MTKYLILIIILTFSLTVEANESNSYVTPSTINISADFNLAPSQKLTPAQKLKKLRKKLEKQNELLIKRKIEEFRYKQEVLLMKKMQKRMEQL